MNRELFSLVGEIEVCNQKAVPGHGEGVNRQVDGRGKCEQKRKNGNKCE